MKNAQHKQPILIPKIAKDIRRARYAKRYLSIFFPARKRTAKFRVTFENARLCNNFVGNNTRQMRVTVFEKSSETIEIGQRLR